MTTTERTRIETAAATREGSTAPSGDATALFVLADETVGAALVDGIGHSDRVARTAGLLAEVAARTAARRGVLAGLLGAGELIADPGAGDEPEPDAVAAVAVTAPGDSTTRVAWVGDARAYGWDGERLTLYSTDQTMGQWVRQHNEVPAEIAAHHDAWVRVSLSTAVVATVREVEIPDPVVILTSDGVHDSVDHQTLEELVGRVLRAYGHNPGALAEALVGAARRVRGGDRDDATALVLIHQGPGDR
ncbi:hypothetical protein OG618_37670 (plasmid) [Kitasatospora sp. NBC_01246]|uniref:hypothetical protein n=1 Tax=Kitasatospora sp. NBC_01246 TaxID=2903570 RepID=UPI002E2FAC92|nr:hypothetical protein [Kitasatospora sp. NBC_01246]